MNHIPKTGVSVPFFYVRKGLLRIMKGKPNKRTIPVPNQGFIVTHQIKDEA